MNGAKWIWITYDAITEEYVTFEKKFIFLGKTLTLKICAETNYIVFLNGKRAAFGQFPNYQDEKYFDELNLMPYAKKGENTLRITVRYEGCDSFTHIDDGAGIIFAVYDDGKQVGVSDRNTLACYDTGYVQHDPRKINFALGYACDMVNASDSVCWVPCVEQSRKCTLTPRPVRKLELTETHEAMLCDAERNVYDIGIETAGYIYLKLRCESTCTVTVAWGEHLADGDVRQKVADYDFSLQFRCKQGENSFENFFVRLGCRYLQVKCDCAVEVERIGIYEYDYPVTVKKTALTGLDKEIYDTCVRTLRLCMHEHYEDCPWREQALYALDSRNQMLCGYRAFQEKSFARANLIYISKSVNENGLLKIISPRKEECGIPFFSLMYLVAVYEYISETGDESILDEVWETLRGILRAFSKRNENGLILTFDKPYWNFYEWSYYSAGDEGGKEYLILNCAYVFAAERFRKLCALRGEIFTENLAEHVAAIHKSFFLPESGLYCVSTEHKDLCSQLGNAFAVLIGLGDIRTYRAIKTCEGLIECTLSMRGFVYDALLAISQKNAAYVLDDIRIRYEKMLDAGATTFWETEEGEKAFERTGSLCHAWSAVPIIYYHKLMPEKFPQNTQEGGNCFEESY